MPVSKLTQRFVDDLLGAEAPSRDEFYWSDRMTGFGTAWTWSKSTMDGPVATFNISSTGVHTLNVWMREDGFVFDKLVLTTSSVYTPAGTGPPSSPRG